jgi:hypothetical protein
MAAVMTTSAYNPPVNNYDFKFPTLLWLASASQCLFQKTTIKYFRFVRSIYLKASVTNVGHDYHKA